jgi:2-keto-4-pentenoate hydratase/2-oxohepta-3-ene-1,7-dioic acid hydratase in catechol pathway
MEHVFGYMNFNDVSARDLQFADGQWQRGKSCDTFAPMGPFVITRDEVPEPEQLRIRFRLNGETLQDSTTAELIFGVAELIEFISRSITLEPGDVIATGTPPGVGFARKPPIFLKAGDVCEVEVEGLGTLTNPVKSDV